MSPTGEQAAIGGKGQAEDGIGLPTRPEQRSARDVPQLDAAIMTAAGQLLFIWAEGEGKRIVGMCLPGQMQPVAVACPTPHPYLPSPADGRPILPIAANGQRRDEIEGLAQGALTQQCPGQTRILYFDFLQIGPAQD